MRRNIFTKEDISKAEAIVRVFETGEPEGDPSAVAVLNDGAGVSYGTKQFTHRSGSLLEVVERYLSTGSNEGRDVLAGRLPVLRSRDARSIAKLAADAAFKNALRAAGRTAEMRSAQAAVGYERYLRPAVEECEAFGFTRPLSLAVVYDSMVHGSWERLADSLGPNVTSEAKWITKYLEMRDAWLRSVSRLRATAYRTKFFLTQVRRGNWDLKLPLDVNGYALTERFFSPPEAARPHPPAAIPPDPLPETHQTGRGHEKAAAPAETLDDVERRVNAVAARVDQAERIVVTAATRTDKAKSLWTTVAGTAWQAAWALGGFVAGVPREVWLVAAVIAGALTLMFLYRQIALGKIRELS